MEDEFEDEILGDPDEQDYDIEDDEGLFYDPNEEDISGSNGSSELPKSNLFV